MRLRGRLQEPSPPGGTVRTLCLWGSFPFCYIHNPLDIDCNTKVSVELVEFAVARMKSAVSGKSSTRKLKSLGALLTSVNTLDGAGLYNSFGLPNQSTANTNKQTLCLTLSY